MPVCVTENCLQSADVHDWFLLVIFIIVTQYSFILYLATIRSSAYSYQHYDPEYVCVCVVVINCEETHWAVCQIATSQSYDSPQNKFNPSGSVTQPLKQNKLTYTKKKIHTCDAGEIQTSISKQLDVVFAQLVTQQS